MAATGNSWSHVVLYISGCTNLHECGWDAEECHGEAGQAEVRDEHVAGRAVLGPAWKEGAVRGYRRAT